MTVEPGGGRAVRKTQGVQRKHKVRFCLAFLRNPSSSSASYLGVEGVGHLEVEPGDWRKGGSRVGLPHLRTNQRQDA